LEPVESDAFLISPQKFPSNNQTKQKDKNKMTTKPTKAKLNKAAALIASSVDYKKYARGKYPCEPLRIAERLAEFCQATAEGRLFCIIHSVSSSGMSRNMSFFETAKMATPYSDGRKYCQLQFWELFKALGYAEGKEGFRIGGCGMDMVFATHYNVIHSARAFGLITEEQCKKLAQMTPTRF